MKKEKECNYSKRLKEIQLAIECSDNINLLTELLLLYSLKCVVEERIENLEKG